MMQNELALIVQRSAGAALRRGLGVRDAQRY